MRYHLSECTPLSRHFRFITPKVVLSKIHSHDGPPVKTHSCTTLCAWHNGQVNPAHPPALPGMPSSGLPITVEPVPVYLYPRTAQPNDCAQWMAQKGLNNLLGHGFHGTTVALHSRVQISGTMNRPYGCWRVVSFKSSFTTRSPKTED